jgi:hypothetical protein
MDCLPDLLQRNTRFNASAIEFVSGRRVLGAGHGRLSSGDTSSRRFGIVIHSLESPVRVAALRVKLENRKPEIGAGTEIRT